MDPGETAHANSSLPDAFVSPELEWKEPLSLRPLWPLRSSDFREVDTGRRAAMGSWTPAPRKGLLLCCGSSRLHAGSRREGGRAPAQLSRGVTPTEAILGGPAMGARPRAESGEASLAPCSTGR